MQTQIKNVQTILAIMFEHKALIIQLVAVLSAVIIIFNSFIKSRNRRDRINNKTNNQNSFRNKNFFKKKR